MKGLFLLPHFFLFFFFFFITILPLLQARKVAGRTCGGHQVSSISLPQMLNFRDTGWEAEQKDVLPWILYLACCFPPGSVGSL